MLSSSTRDDESCGLSWVRVRLRVTVRARVMVRARVTARVRGLGLGL